MRIGFLYNHEALHQISHTAPVAAELSRRPGVEVTVLSSSAAQEAWARELLGEAVARVGFDRLSIGPVARALDTGLRRIAPFRRVAMLRENLPRFAGFDMLVVPETTSLMLRDRFGLTGPQFVWIPHGAGDRSIGYDDVMRGFDLVLLSGSKVRDRMLAAKLIGPNNHAIVGYPKFDTVDPHAALPSPFANGAPTVVYNPHFDPLLSSWFDWGRPIAEWFAAQSRLNFIVAPHVMLFRRRLHSSVEHRRLRWRRDLPPVLRAAPNLLIDTASSRLVDMSYTRAADLYLGDASSQIYEWIARPRPAIFLNPGRIAWQDDPNFAHWHLGEVVDDFTELPAAIDRALARPDRFADRQRDAFASTFDPAPIPAARRAANAILRHWGNSPAV